MDDKFLKYREREIRTKIIMEINAYCDLYDILHGSDNLKTELSNIMDTALKLFLSDNDN